LLRSNGGFQTLVIAPPGLGFDPITEGLSQLGQGYNMPTPDPLGAYNAVLLNQALQRQSLPQNLFPMR
jgi:hypothetical protein